MEVSVEILMLIEILEILEIPHWYVGSHGHWISHWYVMSHRHVVLHYDAVINSRKTLDLKESKYAFMEA